MRTRQAAMIVLLLVAVAVVTHLPSLATAQLSPSVLTDKELYTLRDKQVVLQGIGYNTTQQYVIWIQTPLDNSTRNSGLAFVTTEQGEIPTGVSLVIEPESPFGTYLVSISDSSESDTAVARAHYGIWGTDKSVYQRTEVIQARGGGILPKASLKVTVRNPAAEFVFDATIAANETGAFFATWKIPPDAMTESYTIFIDGVGTYDNPGKEFVAISKFSVTPALLNVTVLSRLSGSYERMQTVSAEFVVRYPDSAPVVTVKEGLMPVALCREEFRVAELALSASDATSGIWTTQFKIPRNATLDVKYRFLLPAGTFDDGNGNTGPASDVETDSFSAVPTELRVSVTVNSTSFQVPFDTLVAYSQVSYSDGTLITNATVRAWLSAADSRVDATVTYDRAAAVWIVTYAFSWGDLLRPGARILSVQASDIYGNAGSASLEVVAEPYTFVEIVLAVVVVLLIARWLLSRFWRRLYIGAKRRLSAIRSRFKSPSLGRYFNNSPVTPWIRSSFCRRRYVYLNR
ncbi:hypothetical protein [[Eubacterium] cellulosolvens]